MRTVVALLGLLLASAQAFHVPVYPRHSQVGKAPFLGSGLARQASWDGPRVKQLRASLEDIERRLAELEKGKKAPETPVVAQPSKAAPAPKMAMTPAPVPAPAPKSKSLSQKAPSVGEDQ